MPLPQPPSPPLPVGTTLPAFTVSDVRGGVLLFDRGRYRTELDLAVLNLANALYAETPNQSFFRPEPQRQLGSSWPRPSDRGGSVDFVAYIPIATTFLALAFSVVLVRRYRARGGPHLLWWAVGTFTYALGTITESLTTLIGWHEPVFRAWYITGALLGGAPLAQGTVYLLLPREAANRLSVALLATMVFGAVCVLASPIVVDRVPPLPPLGQRPRLDLGPGNQPVHQPLRADLPGRRRHRLGHPIPPADRDPPPVHRQRLHRHRRAASRHRRLIHAIRLHRGALRD